jgi:predicted nuclease with RNAse H fold
VSASSIYVGIDVACAAGKRLPICLVASGRPLMPLIVPKHLAAAIPRGLGNREITSTLPFREAAHNVVDALKRIGEEMRWRIERVAVDAPAAPPSTGPRSSEIELARLGLSCFRTPAASEWPGIQEKCVRHLRSGGNAASLPHANKIWMLFGFELFMALRRGLDAEVIEVYPFAIVSALLPACAHKSTEQGYRDQLAAVAGRTGWERSKLEGVLKATVPGSRHDRLDAFMAAWVATLTSEGRRAFGNALQPDDSIWIPD